MRNLYHNFPFKGVFIYWLIFQIVSQWQSKVSGEIVSNLNKAKILSDENSILR